MPAGDSEPLGQVFEKLLAAVKYTLAYDGWRPEHLDISCSLDEDLSKLNIWDLNLNPAATTLNIIERDGSDLADTARNFLSNGIEKVEILHKSLFDKFETPPMLVL
jgi:hypothetical protein